MADEGVPQVDDSALAADRRPSGASRPARLPDADHQVADDLGDLAPVESATGSLLPSAEPAEELPGAAAGGTRLTVHWRSLSDGLILALVVGGPCLLAVEGLRHRVGKAWLVPLVIAGLGFLVAGAIAGRHRRLSSGAMLQGVAMALPVAVLLDLTDLLYRVIGRRPINPHVVGSLVGGLVGAVVLAVIGALIGRWLYLSGKRHRRRPSP